MTKADLLVERGAARLQQLARQAAGRGDGIGEWLSEELQADAEFLRKLKPTLIKARARGEKPSTPPAAGAPPPPPPSPPAPKRDKPKKSKKKGGGPSPARIRELLARLDREQIKGRLELVGSDVAPAAPELERSTFAATWDAELAALPEDWTDLYAEVEFASTDYLERAALLLAPVNPARYGDKPGFRFRAARRFGYGASAEMTRRCLERLDNEGIHGRARVLWALSDTRPVQTQGPVWYTGGKSV